MLLFSWRMSISMKSDPRLNWCFDASSRYSGLFCCLLSSSRRLSRSNRRELRLFVSSSPSSHRRLPRSTRRSSIGLVASVGFCRGSRVEGKMSRVEGKMSRVQKCR